MLRRRGFTLLVLSLALALGAAWVARGWVLARFNPSGRTSKQVPVVVADTEIPFGVTVKARYLRVIDMPADTPLAAHYSDPKQVEGQVALQKVLRGEILLKGQFTKAAQGNMLAALLSPDMRAITVRVNDVVGVAGFLLPGNHVDVVEARMTGQKAVTETVLQNLRVLAVDQTDSHNKNQPMVVRAVTLEVTPDQANVLVKAMTEGHIELTLRGPNAINVATAPPAHAPPPRRRRVSHRVRVVVRRPPEQTITIIRGTNVQQAHAKS